MRTVRAKADAHADEHTNRRRLGTQAVAPSFRSEPPSGFHVMRKAGCACGGGCPGCRAQPAAPPRLKVSTPDDAYEREADSVADQVMSMPAGVGAAARATAARPSIQRVSAPGADDSRAHVMTKGLNGASCDSAPAGQQEEEEEQPGGGSEVMRKASPGESPAPRVDVGAMLSGSRGGGSPLPAATRTFMETRFGHDFGDVRIHDGGDAARMAKDLHAEAFTTGRDIYFRPGAYAPHTAAGKRLLAHELTHVVQQRGGDFVGRSTAGGGVVRGDWIQRFTLNGFPPTEDAAMRAAIPVAKSTVLGCPSGGAGLANAIDSKRYDYKPELGLCGWTFPSSWYIEIGSSAFNTSTCCALASTIAHEASHTRWKTESGARQLECDCFNCSC